MTDDKRTIEVPTGVGNLITFQCLACGYGTRHGEPISRGAAAESIITGHDRCEAALGPFSIEVPLVLVGFPREDSAVPKVGDSVEPNLWTMWEKQAHLTGRRGVGPPAVTGVTTGETGRGMYVTIGGWTVPADHPHRDQREQPVHG